MENLYKILGGPCAGYFGAEDYSEKVIILEGRTWIVCRYLYRDEVVCANFHTEKEKVDFIETHAREVY